MSRSFLTHAALTLLVAGVASSTPAPKPRVVQAPAAPSPPAVAAPVPNTTAVPPVVAPPVVEPVLPPAPPAPPQLPPVAVVLAQPAAAAWLNAAGIPATVVTEAALPEALNNAVLAVVPVQEVRQTATAEALKAHVARGGRVLATYWGSVGARSSAMDTMASVLSINVTGWSGKGNAAIVPAPAGRAYFGATTRLKTGRPFAIVAVPVIPPPPPPAPRPVPVVAPPAPAAPTVRPNTGGTVKPNTGGTVKPAVPGVNAPAPVTPAQPPVPPTPPPPPPPAVAARWVGDDDRPARKAPADAAVISAPGTLWIGEDIFRRENDSPEMRRWLASAAVALAPSLRLPAKQAAIATAQTRLNATRDRLATAAAPGASTALPVADAQRSLQAAVQSLAKASADMEYATVLVDVAAAHDMLLEAEAYLTPSRPVEVRAVWIEQSALSKNIADIRRLVQRLADARFNVILPEVVYAGRAAYPSTVYPQDKRLVGFDPLRALVDEAHRRGMEVHPWVWTLAAGRDGEQGPILRTHPEWAARDKAGRIMTDGDRLFWLSPSVPAARLAVRNVIREIAARYDVDGIHLDYLRFHGPYHDYSDAARAAYKGQSGTDPLEIAPLSPAAAAWHGWREGQVNSLMREIHGDIESVKPGLTLSAAVHQTPEEARRERLQDWPNWAANRWVDWVAPMTYTSDPAVLSGWLAANQPAAAGRALVVPGLAGFQWPDAGPLAGQMSAIRATPSQGMAFFAASQLTDDMLRALRLGAFRTPAVTPWKNPVLAARTLANFAADQLRATPVADANAAVPARAAITDLAAWAAGASLEAFATIPPSVTALAALGPAFDEARTLAAQASEIATLSTTRPASQPIAPTAPPVATVANPAPLPAARVPVAMGFITMDGRLDESGWNGAATLTLDRAHDGERVPVSATVRLLRDATTLYVGFTCPEPNMASLRATHTGSDAPVYQDDSVEVFLSPSSKGLPYYHFIAGAGGGTWDDKSGDSGWGARWTSAISRDAAGWSVEIAIPFNSLEGAPEGAWRANFARNRMAEGPNFLTWSVPYGNYHAPDRFGSLTF